MLTESKMISLGTEAPNFTLLNTVSGTNVSRDELKGDKAMVVMFICNHCPYVQHINQEIVNISNDYMSKGVSFVAISANDADEYPADGPGEMKKVAENLEYKFPYLYDASQEVARAYGASCTPDLFIFDADLNLAYHGQLDDSRPENGISVTGENFRNALDTIIAGNVPENQTPSIGCNIKWK